MMGEQRRDYKVPALEKGLDILELLAAAQEPMSLTSMGQALGRGSSELFRMVGYLVERGYIARDASGMYRLSLKLYELAHRQSPIEQLIKAAESPMRKLAAQVRESCHLSMLLDGELMVVYQQKSPENYRFSVEVGARHDLLGSVSGRIVLAHLPRREREELLRRNDTYNSLSQPERLKLVGRLEEAALLGFSYMQSETYVAVEEVAVLVGHPQIGVVGAICIPKLLRTTDTTSYMALLAPLQECARSISQAAGLSYE